MKKLIYTFFISVLIISCSNPSSSGDDENKEIWIFGNNSTITWNGSEISGNNKSENPDDYTITARYLGNPSAPSRTDTNRIVFTLTDSSVTMQDYENIGIGSINYYLDTPQTYEFLSQDYGSRSANLTPAWFKFSNTYSFNCEDNSTIGNFEYVYENKGQIERTYIFNAKGFEKAIKEIACN
jgi:hypothetical protein